MIDCSALFLLVKTNCLNFECPVDSWKCPNSQICIQNELVCNGDVKEATFNQPCCADFWCSVTPDQDEEMCKNHTCSPGYWKGPTGKCLAETMVCDGREDYERGLDEVDCRWHRRTKGFIKCGDLKTCVQASDNNRSTK